MVGEQRNIEEEIGIFRNVSRGVKNLRSVLMARILTVLEVANPAFAKAVRTEIQSILREETSKCLRLVAQEGKEEGIEYGADD